KFLRLLALLLVAAAIVTFNPSDTRAGRLGVCYKCEYEAYGQTLEVYNWSGANVGALATKPGVALDISGRAKCGGGATPKNTSRAPAHLCDAAAGILRWSNNDPFDPPCPNGSGNHEFRLGGENMDLVVVVENGDTFRSGTFFRVQDGKNYSCSRDVGGGRTFSSLRYGRYRDLFDIYVVKEDGVHRNSYRIQDGKNHQIVSTPTSVGRLYGENRDVITLYHIAPSGTVTTLDGVRIKDGRGYALHPLGNDIGVIYGRKHDVRGRFCFESGAWKQLLGSRDGSFPASCNPPTPKKETYVPKPGIDYTDKDNPILR
ncbi:MAG: hypothetical protein AAFQ87_19320, partial [Bacteroidota bacterium]